MANFLVLGGGTGGIVISHILQKKLKKEHQITLIDRRNEHIYYPSYPLLMIGKREPAAITRKLGRLEKKGIRFLQTDVQEIKTSPSEVITSTGKIPYDYQGSA